VQLCGMDYFGGFWFSLYVIILLPSLPLAFYKFSWMSGSYLIHLCLFGEGGGVPRHLNSRTVACDWPSTDMAARDDIPWLVH
jgi:hypothetical protein